MTDDICPLPPVGRPLRRGEHVMVTCEGRTVEAKVTLASPNGRSIVIMFEAILAGHAGMMPVLQHDDGTFTSLIGQVPIEIKRKEEAVH